MGYSSGMLDKIITIAKRAPQQMGDFGMGSGGHRYWIVGEVHAGEDFDKGTKSMREGALDAYNVVMFRMRWTADIDRWCLIKYEGRWYQIESFNPSFRANKIQITARELANQQVEIVPPVPENALYDADGIMLLDADGVCLTADYN